MKTAKLFRGSPSA